MTEFIDFYSSTPRHDLPLLVAGQAQKEFFVNEALSRLDMLVHPLVEAELADPPPTPAAGACYLVATPATGQWSGRDGKLAGWDGTQWSFASPSEGMAVFDKSESRSKYFRNGWQLPAQPAAPSGGSVVDAEARGAIDQLLELLRAAGLIAP